tara:strand:- start:327 stop:701 length:375 start_codon:yes stop_codon:yes gene_type:complete
MVDNTVVVESVRTITIGPDGGQSNTITVSLDEGEAVIESVVNRIEVAALGPQGPRGLSGGTELNEPVFTYTDGQLTRIVYSGGEIKDLSYTDGQLTSMVFNDGQTTVTKQFNYTDGLLTSITET